MNKSMLLVSLLHLAIFVGLTVLLALRCVSGYEHPIQSTYLSRPSSAVPLPVVTICPDKPAPATLPREPTCLYSLTQGVNTLPSPVTTRFVSTSMRSSSGHLQEYSCYECNADRAAPLPATGLSQLFVEVNQTGSDAFASTLVGYSGGAVDAALPTEQARWLRVYQQESSIHQLTARKLYRLRGADEPSFDVAARAVPCAQATRGGSCVGRWALLVRYAQLDVLKVEEVPALNVLLVLCALAGAASCLLVTLRGSARLLTGAKGMPSEGETLSLIAGAKPPAFVDPYSGFSAAK